ncbi:hypothetical protein [Anaerocolumna jejuensis]|uniref:hypothetical protein n=1 Tax=Anaerocolumna jejuensis TaxID=259063 RepID=UPI003F7B9DDA
MKNDYKIYFEIEYPSGVDIKIPNKLCPDMLPDIYIGNYPVELQEFNYYSQGKGNRSSYNYSSNTSINFNTGQLNSPLKGKLHKHDYFELMFIASDQFEMQV